MEKTYGVIEQQKKDGLDFGKTIEDFVDMAPEMYEKYCRNARKGALQYDFQYLTKKLSTILTEE